MPEDIVPPPDDERYGPPPPPEPPKELPGESLDEYKNPSWAAPAQKWVKRVFVPGAAAYEGYKGLPKSVQEPVGKAAYYGTTGGIGLTSDIGKTLRGKDAEANEEQTARIKAQMYDSLSPEGKRRYDESKGILDPDQQSRMLRDLSLVEKRGLMSGGEPEQAPQSGAPPMAGGGGRGSGGGGGAPGMTVDAQGNLVPGLVRTQMSKTVQGQTPVPKEVPELIMDAAKHDVAGVAARAQGEAQAAQAQAEGAAGVKVLNEKMAMGRQRAEQSRVNEVGAYMDDLEKRLGALEAHKIDPDYVGSLTGGQKFLMALGMFAGTLGSSLAHSENVAMKLFQQQAADFIGAQKANYEIQKDAFSAKKSLYGDLLETHKDERLAEKEMEAMAYKQMEAELKRRLAIAQDPRIRAQLEAGIAGIEKELAKSLFGLSQAMYGKTSISEGYSLPKPRGGGGAAPRKKTKDAHWLYEKTNEYGLAKDAAKDAIDTAKLYQQQNPGKDPLSPAALILWKSGPAGRMAYNAYYGDGAEKVIRTGIGALSLQRKAETGSAFGAKEERDHEARFFGSGGIKAYEEGLKIQHGRMQQRVNSALAADPAQAEFMYESHRAQGTDPYTPQRYSSSIPAEDD